ncbi:MAG: RNA-binding protein, partial [Lachnospiraceae bacterium]|nr:RNA-binding protein [Lachnospiraceae bacterium]
DFNEKSEPWFIKEKTGMSKAAFKRAIGHLLKERLITITESEVVRKR